MAMGEDVEPHTFNLFNVPAWAWELYEAHRLEISNRALAALKGVTDLAELGGYMPVSDAAAMLKERGLRWGASTLQQNISRGVLRGQKVQGTSASALRTWRRS